MGLIELFALAVGLSMDAFAVAVCKGLSLKKAGIKAMAIVGFYFGLFQAVMPLIGYFLGIGFKDYIVSFDHWIAFILLVIIGINMIREAFDKDDEETENADSLSFKSMFPLAIATSIDALAVGVTLAFLNVKIWFAVNFIGITTFVLSCLAVKIGNVFGTKYKAKAELAGGIILIIIGLKILIEHVAMV